MQTQLNLHPGAVMKRLKFLRCGNGSNFEIFEYSAPDQRLEQPENSDIGGIIWPSMWTTSTRLSPI
ncbi:hypothetical protein [Aquamicrobium soli]|jgi:hypothetical protein|uniref:Uncharacterized protein n=1 Tax=Aquamicrobium soli TaxID=1811518 RepID=A0ABV7K3B9_9HYPH